MAPLHFLLITFPAQGHVNPTLQFAKLLIRNGAQVTCATAVSAHRHMSKSPTPEGLSFASFSDGYDDGYKPAEDDPHHFMSEHKRRGTEALAHLIVSSRNEGRPVSCLVYTLLLPWAAGLARQFEIPSALLWIQPATVLDIYYYYFCGYGDLIRDKAKDPSFKIELPGLPAMASRDLPSFIVPSSTNKFALPTFQQQIETLGEEINPRILVNTFDALEPEALKAIPEFNMVAVGPLIPSAYLDGKYPSDTSFGGDLFQGSKDYLEWLNSKPESSVVYVSFGTLAVVSKQQLEEVGRGLLGSGRPFLWVMREDRTKHNEEQEKEQEAISTCRKLERQGMIVPWCSQVEVLSHPSVGCFVTHCGWNSTLESIVCGIPVVAFPQWTDQGTNAKLIQDEWKTGVRVTPNEEGIAESKEIQRCLELVMAERAEELRANAKQWQQLAKEAAKPGGSSDKNLRAFVEEFAQLCHSN